MAEDEPAEDVSRRATDAWRGGGADGRAAIVAARAEGIAVPPDLARKTFAATRKLAALARRRDAG